MRAPALRLSLDELIVDNFAGGGGASLGMEMGLGRSPDIAINHDREAVEMHAANHPTTRHYCEDVWTVDPVRVCGGRPVGLAWFSPDCKHFSKAKGGKPVNKNIRGLAWVVIRWARAVRPRVIILENVEEFAQWGPLGDDGKPCPLRKGFTFRRWKAGLENLGYKVEHRELVACDFGAPTTRKRLFLIARCDGQPIVWPEPTHGPSLLPYRTAAECIDWSLPTYSIFLTREEGKRYRVQRPLADNTMRRIVRGLRKFVIDAPEPFIVPYYGLKANETRAHSTAEPLRTQTGDPTFSLVTPFVAPITHTGDERVHSLEDPLRTITAARRGEQALIAPFITKYYGDGEGRVGVRNTGVAEPVHTVTSWGHNGLIAPVLVPRYGERLGQEPRALPIDRPMPTIVPTQNEAQLVSAFLAKHYGGHETPGGALPAPLDTVTARDHNALVASSLVKLKGTAKDGQAVDAPLHTVQAGGLHYAEVRAFMVAYYGNEKDGGALTDPVRTVTAHERFGLVTVHGEPYVIADIGMRMLAPRELYRAQGFPDSYVINPVVDGRPLPKDAQVRMVGNSVCPPLAAVIARAQFVERAAEAVA